MEYSENLKKCNDLFVNFSWDSPLIGHGAVRHQHHWLEAPGLPGSGDGQVVPHKAGVNLAVVHGAGVHVLGLRHLHQLDLLAGQGVGQASQDGHVKQGDDGQGEGPANPAVTQLVVIRLEMDMNRLFVKAAIFYPPQSRTLRGPRRCPSLRGKRGGRSGGSARRGTASSRRS